MLTFNPPELQDELLDGIKSAKLERPDFCIIDLRNVIIKIDNFDPSRYPDYEITCDTEIDTPNFRNNKDDKLTVRSFIDLLKEYKKAKFIDVDRVFKGCYVGNDQTRWLISPSEKIRSISIWYLYNENSIDLVFNEKNLSIRSCKENTVMNFSGGYYTFEIKSKKPLNQDEIECFIYAFYFEMDNIGYPEERLIKEKFTIKPLLSGKGLKDLLALYYKILSIDDSEVEILYYYKILEYISQTVVSEEKNEAVIKKLETDIARIPDAQFVGEMEKLFDNYRKYQNNDGEAIRHTVEKCCEIDEICHEISEYLPCLTEIKKYSTSPSEKSKNQIPKALSQMGRLLVNTRNNIIHAKPNHKGKNREICPKKDYEDFANCINLAVRQAIRWFARQPDNKRVIGEK